MVIDDTFNTSDRVCMINRATGHMEYPVDVDSLLTGPPDRSHSFVNQIFVSPGGDAAVLTRLTGYETPLQSILLKLDTAGHVDTPVVLAGSCRGFLDSERLLLALREDDCDSKEVVLWEYSLQFNRPIEKVVLPFDLCQIVAHSPVYSPARSYVFDPLRTKKIWTVDNNEPVTAYAPWIRNSNCYLLGEFAFSHDERYFIIRGTQGEIWFWDLEKDQVAAPHTYSSGALPVCAVASSPTRPIVAVGGGLQGGPFMMPDAFTPPDLDRDVFTEIRDISKGGRLIAKLGPAKRAFL